MQLHPDESVCFGATIYAAMLSGQIAVNDMDFKDVIPLTLGTEKPSDDPEEEKKGIEHVHPMIEGNSPIPTSKSQSFRTYEDNQTHFDI